MEFKFKIGDMVIFKVAAEVAKRDPRKFPNIFIVTVRQVTEDVHGSGVMYRIAPAIEEWISEVEIMLASEFDYESLREQAQEWERGQRTS